MDLFRDYLWPDVAFCQAVLVFMIGVMLVWALWFINAVFQHLSHRRQLKRLLDPTVLQNLKTPPATAIPTAPSTPVSEEKAPRPPAGPDYKSLQQQRTRFLKICKFNKATPVADHVMYILRAGQAGQSIDIRGLLEHTFGKLFPEQRLLRSVSNLFIIIGLLGTLIGLAFSMNSLGSLSEKLHQAANMRAGLGSVLIDLRSAFAPSIWGVVATIATVLIQTFYARLALGSLAQKIEQETYFNWIPLLAPSPDETLLQKNEELLRSTIAAQATFTAKAATLASMLEDLEQRMRVATESTTDYVGAIHSVERTAELLREGVADRLVTFGESFAKSTTLLVEQQTKLLELHEQIRQEGQVFRAGMAGPLAEQSLLIKAISDEIKEIHSGTLTTHQEVLERWIKIELALQLFINEATGKMSAEREKDRAVLGSIKESIQLSLEAVRRSMATVETEANNRMAILGNQMTNYGDKISNSVVFVGDRTKSYDDTMSKVSLQIAESLKKMEEQQTTTQGSLAPLLEALDTLGTMLNAYLSETEGLETESACSSQEEKGDGLAPILREQLAEIKRLCTIIEQKASDDWPGVHTRPPLEAGLAGRTSDPILKRYLEDTLMTQRRLLGEMQEVSLLMGKLLEASKSRPQRFESSWITKV